MLHRFIRFALLAALLATSALKVSAQPCPDTEPLITGTDVVCASLSNTLSYTTPAVALHNYSWVVTRTSAGAGGWSVVGSTTTAQLDIRWTAPGNYRLTLTEGVIASGCTPKTVWLDITVQPFLVAYFTYVATSECFNNIVEFHGDYSSPPSGDPTLTYEWTFSNAALPWSTTSNVANPTITFPVNPGITYDATLKVKKTDSFGRVWEDAITDYIYVDPNKYKPIALYTATPVGCLYDGIRFDASASQPTHVPTSETILHFTWNFGDGTGDITYPGTQPIVIHNYAAYGNYTILLTVTNTKYCTETTTPYILNVANTIPLSQFLLSPACLNELTEFDPRSSITPVGTITDLLWTFGDGSQATTHDVNQIVTHTYTEVIVPDPATLKVKNSLGCWSDIYQLPVSVFLAPRAVFSHEKACQGNPVIFTNTSQREGGSVIVLNEWDFGDSQTSTDLNPTHLYTGTGIFTVTLTVTNQNGCKDVTSDVLTVSPRPDVDFTSTQGSSPYVMNFTEVLNPTQFVGNNLEWDFGDGTSTTGSNPVHPYPGPGTFLVTLTGTDMVTQCPNTVQHSITLGSTPTAYFTADPQDQCQGQPISFIPTVPPGGFIQDEDWYFNDGSLPNPVHFVFPNTPAFPVHTFTNSGTYLVERYVNRGTANEAYHSLFVTIHQNPLAGFTWFSDAGWTHQGVGCDHQPVYFKDVSDTQEPPGVVYKWLWDFGDPASGPQQFSNLQNPNHTFIGTSPFTVTLTVTDNLRDCENSISHQVIINPPIPVAFTFTNNNCLDQLATFTPDPALIPTDYTWLWNFGDGFTSTVGGPVSHLFSSIGVYTVSLTLTDQYGCSKSISHDITIIPVPVADFTFTSPTCNGQPIQFTDLSYVPNPYPDIITAWAWDFGDGLGTSTLRNPVYTYPNFNPPGYDVRLTVTTNNGCTATRIYHVQPIPSPDADFITQPLTPVCAGQAVQFQDQSQTNGVALASWLWDFGDPLSGTTNNSSTAQNPIHTYNYGAGPYQVTLTVKNANNCSSTIVKTITINTPPTADFTATEACMGTNTAFTDNSTTPPGTTISTYTWDFGDLTGGTGPNPQHAYATYGTYNVRLTIVNTDLCVNEIVKQVRVHPNPIPDFAFSASSCIGNPVSYTNLSSMPPGNGFPDRPDIWVWDFGDASLPVTINYPNSPDIIHTFLGASPSHLVTLTVTTNTGCVESIQKTVNSVPSPVANFSYSGNQCENQDIQFTDQTSEAGGGAIQTWAWDFGDPLSGAGNTSPLPSPIHTFKGGAATYTVTLVVTNYNGCTSTKIDNNVVINKKPVSDFTATAPCENSPTVFTNNSNPWPPAAIVASFWEFGDGFTSNQPAPTHTYLTFGIFNVKLRVTNSNGCMHDTTKQVSVFPKPTASFTFSANACVGNPVNYFNHSTVPGNLSSYIQTWAWDFNDGSPVVTITYPANPDQTHTFLGPGIVHTVRLTVTTTAGCTNFIDQVVTSIPSPVANFHYSTTNCLGQSVQFTDDTQTGGGTNIQFWHWDFGDPGSGAQNASSLQNPVHVFVTTGTKTVTLTVTSLSGCVNTTTKTITINGKPVAKFIATTACLGSVTTFTDQSTPPTGAAIVGHFWEFGDGGTATIANPTYTYVLAGNYGVKLTVTTDQGCVHDTTIYIDVLGKPISTFSFSSPTCSTDSVHFTDHSSTPHGSINKWDWYFGDGSPIVTRIYPASPNVSHKFPNGGTFNVTLTITTSDLCTAVKTLPVLVEFAPLANFEFTANSCALVPIQFTDLSQQNSGAPITQWHWDFDDPGSGIYNTADVKNPTHAFMAGGTFDVTLIVTNGNGCKDTIQHTITVNNAPYAQFSADTACILSPTQFTDESTTNPGTIIAWLWNFGEPASGIYNTSTSQNPTHDYLAPGTYTVSLTVTNTATCTKDTAMQISVNPKPVALFEYDASCIGDSTQFTDLSIAPGSSITDWLWDFSDGVTSTLQNPKHAFATSGTFQVKLIVSNLTNCKDSVTIPVIVREKPTAAFVYVNFFCPAGQVNFQDQSHGAGSAITGHLWTFEPGYTSDLVNPIHVFPVTDMKYWVQLIVTDNYGCKDTIGDSVYVKPGFSFTFTNDTVCLGYPTQFNSVNNADGDSLYSVVWNFGDPNSGPGNISYLYNPTHVFTQPGLYSVKMKAWNSNNCVDSVYRDIQVFAPPKPGFAFQTVLCDSTVYFNDTTSITGTGPIASWEWLFGDGTPPLIIPAPGPGDTSHLYVNPGIYPVTLIITNSNGCVDSLTQNVQRFPCIRAVFSYQDTLRCARYQISFSDSSLPISRINQWHWNWGDGKDTTYISHGTPITHIYADSGTYAVTLAIEALVDGITIKDSITSLITIHPTPYSLFSNTAVCLNQPTIFLDNSNTFGEPVFRWNWEFGEPASGVKDTSTFQNPTHKYMDKGLYDVQLLIMNRFGCEDSLTKTTRVYGLPVAHFINSVACTGDPTYFNDLSVISDTTAGFWAWNFGDLNSNKDTANIEDPEYRYRTEGDYSVRFIVKDFFGCSDTVDSTVRVNITPTSAFTFTENFDGRQGKVKLNNLSDGATLYNWDFGNGSTSTEDNPIISYSEDGTYIIKLIALNQFDCSDTTFYEYKLLFKGLYVPNAFSPTNTILSVRLFQPIGMNLKQYHVTVFDGWGHLVWESTELDDKGRPAEGWDGTYNGELLPQGNYMWKVNALFVDDTPWNGSDIGMGEYSTMGSVTLIR